MSKRYYGWVLERALARLSRNRRLAKDYERVVQTSVTFMEVATMHLVLRRLTAAARQQVVHLRVTNG